jgi:hypothetical protein
VTDPLRTLRGARVTITKAGVIVAKKNGSSLAVAEPPTTAIATATAADFGGGLIVKGKSETSMNISRLTMYQGTPEEEKMYGQHTRGMFLDALENRELDTKVRIMPVIAFATWSLWEKGAKQPTETWHDENDVPPDLMQWTEKDGKRVPPQAQEAINVICCVDGENWPYLFVFKRTSLKAFQRTIGPLENRRAAQKKSPGLYELTSEDDKNADNQTFKRLKARFAGDPSPELTALALHVFKMQQQIKAKAAEMAQEEPAGNFDPDKV